MEIMHGYKRTEVGIIPENWNVALLNDISSITRLAGAEYSSVWKEDEFGEIIALRGFNIGNNQIIERDLVRISNELSLKLKRSRLKKNDVVYPVVGTIGNAVVINEDNKYHIQQNIARITPKSQVEPVYLAYFLMSDLGYIEVMRFNATSSQPNVLVGSLRQYRIPLPPLPEQKAIAEVLSDTDNLIQTLEKQIAKKRLIKQGAMQKLLSPKEGWEEKKLGEFLQFEQPTKYLVSNTDYDDNYDIPVLTAGKSFVLGYSDDNHGIFKSVPVIIFDDFTTASKYVTFPFKAKSSAMKILKPVSEDVNLRFIYESMQQIKYPLGDHKRHWIGEFQHLAIKVPTIEEQRRIERIISDMDAEIQFLAQKISKYHALKKGLMQNLLTGKIRLNLK